MKQRDPEERASRWIVLVIIGVVIVILSIFCIQMVRMFSNLTVRISPKPITVTAPAGQQVVATDCYAYSLPSTYAIDRRPNCEISAYARSEKYRYVNVEPYYESSEEAVLQRWRTRWLTLGAVEESCEQTEVAGRRAWCLVEKYPQNGERFITYLVILARPLPIDSRDRVTAFEIRGWATTPEDEQQIRDVVASWQWRV